jgi:transcriptional regulator with XRE-family HTH domain
MPNIDQGAKAWELELSGRVGKAVLRRRKALGLTAVQLADKTRDLGYPITRVAITKVETNKRAGKLDIAEVLVLAVALEIPPALLLFPSFPERGRVELLPGYDVWPPAAVRWLCGESPLPVQIHADDTVGDANPQNAGTELVGAFARQTYLEARLRRAQFEEQFGATATPEELAESGKRLVQDQEALAAVNREIDRHRGVLWGSSAQDEEAGHA